MSEEYPDDDDVVADDESVDEGEVLYAESGGAWWVVAIGPVLCLIVLITEIIGGGRLHWPALLVFALVIGGFSLVQVYAARTHVSMMLTERSLRQGAQTILLDEIAEIFPENNSPEPQKWESAPALGELSAVPRRRKGVGIKMTNGKLAQAWARDVSVFRSELVQAQQAVALGLGPKRKPRPDDD
ncbi:hypothetical protein [Williamsia soli]|uniref:hypothetical protein n=1 Tax=Williamsia soli TaxID=364929 RepID=UPI001A9EB555|nr:hypothetical protein [Williamsia soli]